MEPHDYWRAIRKGWYFIVTLALIGAVAGFVYAKAQPNVYRASSSLFVSTGTASNVDQVTTGSNFVKNVVSSYATLATTQSVLIPVIEELNLNTTSTKLARSITATNPTDTVIIEIAVTDGSANRATEIANAVARSLRAVATDVSPTNASGQSALQITVVQPAALPQNPVGPNRRLMLLTAAILGAVAGLVLALLRFLFDTRIQSSRDAEVIAGSPLLGTVRRSHHGRSGLATVTASTSETAEDYRRLAATLRFAGATGSVRSLLVTAPTAEVPSAEVGVNLAVAASERSQNVLVIDADLRSPSVATLAGLPGTLGLTDLLEGIARPTDAIQTLHTDAGSIDVLTTGALPSNPSIVLGAAGTRALFHDLSESYDLVVVIAPPVLDFADALVLADKTDNVLVVSTTKRTRRSQLDRTISSLENVKAHLLGVVLTESSRATHPERPSDLAATVPASEARPSPALTAPASAESAPTPK